MAMKASAITTTRAVRRRRGGAREAHGERTPRAADARLVVAGAPRRGLPCFWPPGPAGPGPRRRAGPGSRPPVGQRRPGTAGGVTDGRPDKASPPTTSWCHPDGREVEGAEKVAGHRAGLVGRRPDGARYVTTGGVTMPRLSWAAATMRPGDSSWATSRRSRSKRACSAAARASIWSRRSWFWLNRAWRATTAKQAGDHRRREHHGHDPHRRRRRPAGRRRWAGRRGAWAGPACRPGELAGRARSCGAGPGRVNRTSWQSPASFSTARRRALSARRLAATSAADGLRAPRLSRRTVGAAPHTQGRPGGQVQPPVAADGSGP